MWQLKESNMCLIVMCNAHNQVNPYILVIFFLLPHNPVCTYCCIQVHGKTFLQKQMPKCMFFWEEEYFDVDDDEMWMKCTAMESILFMIY